MVEQFNAQGQVTNRTGEAVYPVAVAYNPYGQLTRMRTWHKDYPSGDDITYSTYGHLAYRL